MKKVSLGLAGHFCPCPNRADKWRMTLFVMPKFSKIMAGLILTITCSLAYLSGEYTVGSGGYFTTLTAALNTWKTESITGDVIFRLLDSSYPAETYPLKCSIPAGYIGGNWTLMIKPDPILGARPLIQGSNATTILDLNGVNRVMVDSVEISNTSTSGPAVRFFAGASYNIIKNSVLKGVATSTSVGVVRFLSSMIGLSGNNSNTIENCDITQGATYTATSICFGGSGNLFNENNTIKKCNIYDFRQYGIFIDGYNVNTTITECDIYTTTQQTGTTMHGIYIRSTMIANTVSGTNITRNKIHDLWTSAAYLEGTGICLLDASVSVVTTIANNFISLDATHTHSGGGDGMAGIHEGTRTGALVDIYYNSIYIGGTGLTTNQNTWGIGRFYATIMNAKNNIVFNNRTQASGTGKHYCFYADNTSAGLFTDYNDFYVSDPGGTSGQLIGNWGTSPCTTLAAWQTASGKDTNSISLNPDFVSITPPVDLHISSFSTNVNNQGTPIAGITTDIDGETRSPTTPDIGADEYTPISIEEEMPNLWSEEKPKVLSPFFNEKISIRLTNSIKSPCRITLYNAFGRIVYEALHSTTASFLILDDKGISNLTQGVYFLKISPQNNIIMTAKLIKL